jgi:hypothetical protein
MAPTTKAIDVDLFEPRDYQLEFVQQIEGGIKKALAVWPRRSQGKISSLGTS